MAAVSRILLLAGAAGLVVSAVLPWVRVEGLPVSIDLDLVGVDLSAGSTTVSGTETSVWPVVLGVGAVVAVLALAGVARKLLLGLGLLVAVAGGALVYYAENVIDIETSGRSIVEQVVAGAVLESSTGAGPPVMLASGIAILLGALIR